MVDRVKLSFLKRLKKPKASIAIDLPEGPFTLGEELNGTITVESEEEVTVNEVILKLVCIEGKKKIKKEWDPVEGKTEEPYWDEAVLVNIKRKVSGPLSLTSGLKKDFPFSVKVPKVGRESYYSVDANVKWYVVARLDIKKRRNISTNELIQVTKPSTAPQVIKEKEIIKEVVMIPCKYCQGLMPQTSTFCSNCGARRKA